MKDICNQCGGTGSVQILSNPHDPDSASYTDHPCPGCYGKGLQSLWIGRKRVDHAENKRAADAAVKVILEHLGKKAV